MLCFFIFATEQELPEQQDMLKREFELLPDNIRIHNRFFKQSNWEPRIYSNNSDRQELNSPYNWFRFYLEPEHVDGLTKIVYLDTDIFVRADISKLYNQDLHGHAVGGVTYPQPLSDYLCSPLSNLSYWKEALGTEAREYLSSPARVGGHLNAGVLVIDLLRWKQQQILDRWSRLVLLHETNCLWTMSGQPDLELALGGQYKQLPEPWNHGFLGSSGYLFGVMGSQWTENFARDCETSHLLHWNGPHKPWKVGSVKAEEQRQKKLHAEILSILSRMGFESNSTSTSVGKFKRDKKYAMFKQTLGLPASTSEDEVREKRKHVPDETWKIMKVQSKDIDEEFYHLAVLQRRWESRPLCVYYWKEHVEVLE